MGKLRQRSLWGIQCPRLHWSSRAGLPREGTHTHSQQPSTDGWDNGDRGLSRDGIALLPPMASMPPPAAPAWPSSGQEVRLCPDSLRNRVRLWHHPQRVVTAPQEATSTQQCLQVLAVTLVPPPPQRLWRAWPPAFPKWAGGEGTGWPQWGHELGAAKPSPTSINAPLPHSRELPFPSREVKCFFASTLTVAPSAWLGKLQPDCKWGFRAGCQAGRASPLPWASMKREL